MWKMLRSGLVVLGLVATFFVVGAGPADASTRCSGWKQVGTFRERTCVIHESSSRIRHRIYVQNLSGRSATVQVTAFSYINGQTSVCKSAVRNTFAAHQTRSWSCTTVRVKNYTYFTRGYVVKPGGGNVGVDSPKITG